MVPLSPLTESQILALFPRDDVAVVRHLLETQCGDGLPLVASGWTTLIERIRAGVLRLSGGRLDRLRAAIDDAHRDWRDVLVAAGFGHDLEAHRRWQPTRSPGSD